MLRKQKFIEGKLIPPFTILFYDLTSLFFNYHMVLSKTYVLIRFYWGYFVNFFSSETFLFPVIFFFLFPVYFPPSSLLLFLLSFFSWFSVLSIVTSAVPFRASFYSIRSLVFTILHYTTILTCTAKMIALNDFLITFQ